MKTVGHRLLPTALLIVALLVATVTVLLAAYRPLTHLEGALLQSFVLLLSLGGSYLFGKQAAGEAARELIKPHARSAFRRLVSLYNSLGRVANEITVSQSFDDDAKSVVLARLGAIVTEQLATADDALEDWRDVVPEDVEELRSRVAKRSKERIHD